MDAVELEGAMSSVLGFRLDVLCEENKNLSWDVDGSWSIDNVKEKIEEMEGTHPKQQRLYYEGEELTRGDWCLFDLKEKWSLEDIVVSMEMKTHWLDTISKPMTTFQRDLARSRSRSRSQSRALSDLGNENCIF